jgi:hypothetical protein
MARQPNHADNQARYHIKKKQTHQKVCVWVPKPQVAAFKKSLDRMRRKWAKID